jgi:hypothetical protein
VEQLDVEFSVEGNVTRRGWLFVPDGPTPRPAITMAHGYAGIRELGLDRFARVFADTGFVALVHDHRGFGVSDGWPRFDIDPWRQIADWLPSIPARRGRRPDRPVGHQLCRRPRAGAGAVVASRPRPTPGQQRQPRCPRRAGDRRFARCAGQVQFSFTYNEWCLYICRPHNRFDFVQNRSVCLLV